MVTYSPPYRLFLVKDPETGKRRQLHDEAKAKQAAKDGRTIREVAREETGLSEAELDQLLKPERMTEPGLGGGGGGG